MTEYSIHHENIRFLGRMDESQDPICLDWTGSGFEVQFQGRSLWAELEATQESPDMWVCCTVDGSPVSRFLVEPGRRYYPLVYGMDAALSRRIALMKETQPMPHAPGATVRVHGLKHDGILLPVPEPKMRIEFIGDSLSSAEGSLAPRGNTEWISMWFSACANYSFYCCRELDAERRLLSQSGRGVYWDYTGNRAGNMADDYDSVCGVLRGPEAEARGCGKAYDFAAWPADMVCIRLMCNDASGLNRRGNNPENRRELIRGAADFVRHVRSCNPRAYILWVLPPSDTMPELAQRTVALCQREGINRISVCALPDYLPEDMGARSHPNARYNCRAGLILSDHIKRILRTDTEK